MRPQEWNHALRPEVPVAEAYAIIAKVARVHLTHNIFGDGILTHELVEGLYPIAFAKQSEAGMAARKRIMNALTKRALGAHELADCMSIGPKQWLPWLRTHGRPCIWHAPGQVITRPQYGTVHAHV